MRQTNSLKFWLREARVVAETKPRGVLFLCVANSARSQMAEGIARTIASDGVTVLSAGSEPKPVRPEAIQVLAEKGVDITSHQSKSVDDIDREGIDTIVTLCAEESCPAGFETATRLHWALRDPATLDEFRLVRDELGELLRALLDSESSGGGRPA